MFLGLCRQSHQAYSSYRKSRFWTSAKTTSQVCLLVSSLDAKLCILCSCTQTQSQHRYGMMCLSLSLVTTFLPWVCPPSCYSLTVCCQPLCQLIAWLCSSIAANLMCHPLVASFAKLLSLHMQWYKKMSRSTNFFYAACCAYLWTAAACLRPTLLPTFLALLQSDLCSCSLLKLQQVIRSLSSGEGPNTIKTLQQVSPWAMACKKALTGS